MLEEETVELKYLKKIFSKLMSIEERLREMEKKTLQLGMSCERAFQMTKPCVQELSEHQKELNDNLDTYGGVITSATWM